MRPPVLVAGWQCPAEAEGELTTDWGTSRRWRFDCHLPDGHDQVARPAREVIARTIAQVGEYPEPEDYRLADEILRELDSAGLIVLPVPHYDAAEDLTWADGPPPGWRLGQDGRMTQEAGS